MQLIDYQGYRLNVGIILGNRRGSLLWARRCGQEAWQFPQGGVRKNESLEQAMFRELRAEVGLLPEHVKLLGQSRRWLRYRLPKRYRRQNSYPRCVGQKQMWFMLRLECGDEAVRLDCCDHPEFDCWRWVDYWLPSREVIPFKRQVYQSALREFAPLMCSQG